jgi:hypothetical protein
MTKDQLWNLADCATNRAVHYLVRDDNQRAARECDAAEMYQRWHSYTLIDIPNPYFPAMQ